MITNILITVPKRFFNEYPGGLKAFETFIENMNADNMAVWYNTISNIPKASVQYCYSVYRGKVQYRLNVMEFQRNRSISFAEKGKRRDFPNKNWVLLTAPVIKARIDIPMKGFQGFRYTEQLF